MKRFPRLLGTFLAPVVMFACGGSGGNPPGGAPTSAGSIPGGSSPTIPTGGSTAPSGGAAGSEQITGGTGGSSSQSGQAGLAGAGLGTAGLTGAGLGTAGLAGASLGPAGLAGAGPGNGGLAGAENLAGGTAGGASGATAGAGKSAAGSPGAGAGGASPEGGTTAGTSSSNGGAAGDTGLGTGGGLPVSNLEMEVNPNMVTSCYVTWTTATPATSEVQFGVDGYQYSIRHDELVTEHRVLVIGMHASTQYQIRAISTDEDGLTAQGHGNFVTGPLPAEIPDTEITIDVPEDVQPGWTLTNIQRGDDWAPAMIVMFDEQGEVVWYFMDGPSSDLRGDVPAILLPNNNVLVGAAGSEPPREVDLAGNVVWVGPTAAVPYHHHVGKLDNGNYVVMWNEQSNEYGILGIVLQEVTPARDVAWSWRMMKHVVPPQDAAFDWCHGNSATIDETNDFIYLSCRYLGVFKAHRYDDQSVIWHLGTYMDGPDTGDMTYVPLESRPSDIHDPEFHDDGTVILFDNGGYVPRGGGKVADFHTRVLEYAIDEEALTATRVWEFPGDFPVDSWYKEDWYTPKWGDADRLQNDNVLITAGLREPAGSTRIFEATRDGRVVWQIVLEPNYGSYRAERISPPPLVTSLP